MKYAEMNRKHREEMEALPIAFAFSDAQFHKALEKLGVELDNAKHEVVKLHGGGFMKKADTHLLHEMMERHTKELTEAMESDDWLRDAMLYELGNHEYCITYDPSDALGALGIEVEDIDERIKRLLSEAIQKGWEVWQP